MGRRGTAGVIATLAFACLAPGAGAQTLQPLDKQQVQDQYDMSWGDYKPIPNTNYQDPAVQPTVKKWKVALVLGDFTNRDFYVTQAPGSTVFGNPQATAANIPRAEVGRFYADFLNKPQALNNYQTMNRYWMENSFGKYGVELVPFGPYRLDARLPVLGADHGLPDAAGHAVRQELQLRAAGEVDRRGRRGRGRLLRQHLLGLRRPGPELDLAGVRQRQVPQRELDPGGVRAAGRVAAQLGLDALRAVDLVGRARERVAERVGQQLDRGRELGHGDLRP